MKKIFTMLVLAMLVFSFSPTFARTTHQAGQASLVEKKSEYKALVNRVYEIRDMDKSNLSASEKLVLRNELNSIRTKLSDPNFTGLYLSSGVIIIILIVLLILALR